MKAMPFAALLVAMSVAATIPTSWAESLPAASNSERYVPQLANIMTAAQLQHLKLWSAGTARNWPLAAYELQQIKESLVEAALLYRGIPVSNITTLASTISVISEAIDRKDPDRFVKEFGELTKGCNSCHQSMDHAFIVLRTPAEQPFSNQAFQPKGKP
ncbi:hypothetical protein [Bradyrhizobium quebecense]|uniref:Uncharacterized protein n=2 Tax=Bradyrhizobium quebecense TaxID=2748629 RepID=A0ACD3VKS8_9BRAD|nr:hypothetical protein [Bradyrhizobium quebecense]UGY06928.1 hypothetical protein J4P68_0020255 [Bradyrhizobium quebecense]